MSFLRRNNKPKPLRPPVDLTWRRPKLAQPVDQAAYEKEWGAFDETALSDADVWQARSRGAGVSHE
jgi:hypothetical protein